MILTLAKPGTTRSQAKQAAKKRPRKGKPARRVPAAPARQRLDTFNDSD